MPLRKTEQSDEKQLAVKTNVVKRLVKEVAHYRQETKENEDRVSQMERDGKDKYDLKKAAEVLEETRMMVPDATRRLNDALDDLEVLFENVGDEALRDSANFAQAKAFLKDRETLVSAS
mmetsp:Transcript_1350/g.3926  ORF Transcript_1350/g.3926 Transcript_1350/m.3926 type:complete len:119 (+) Transcript_1350:115-471(+)